MWGCVSHNQCHNLRTEWWIDPTKNHMTNSPLNYEFWINHTKSIYLRNILKGHGFNPSIKFFKSISVNHILHLWMPNNIICPILFIAKYDLVFVKKTKKKCELTPMDISITIVGDITDLVE